MSQINDRALEEQIDNLPTDLEVEQESDKDTSNLERPYDPTLIRVDPKMFSLRNVLDMIQEGDLDLAPDFQRLQVWKARQKSRLIESVLLRIPLPAFYFSSDSDGRLQVVDGVQRLSTIYEFVRGGRDGKSFFALNELEYLQDEVGGKTFQELANTSWAKRLNATQISANVIDPQTPSAVKFDIFKRINTGGTPLTSQEIRHCMSGPKSRALLINLSRSDQFISAAGSRISGHIRMADREMILRTLAFRLNDALTLQHQFPSLDDFLNWATIQIDTEISAEDLNYLETGFLNAMKAARWLFGKHAFRKWPANEEKLYPLNKALFEVWGVLLAPLSYEQLEPCRDDIVSLFRNLLVEDRYFLDSISSATGDPSKVLYRFNAVREILEACLG